MILFTDGYWLHFNRNYNGLCGSPLIMCWVVLLGCNLETSKPLFIDRINI